MRSSLMLKVVGFLAALSLTSAAFAATPPASKCGPPTPEPQTWNFSKEASCLLSQLHEDAYQVRDSADSLEALDRERGLSSIDWQIDAVTLDSMGDQINKMDQILSRLQTIEKVLPPEQRTEINETAPAVMELTDSADAAIDYLKTNHDRLFLPPYTAYAREMYSEAGRIERSTVAPAEKALVGTKVNESTETRNLSTGSGSSQARGGPDFRGLPRHQQVRFYPLLITQFGTVNGEKPSPSRSGGCTLSQYALLS